MNYTRKAKKPGMLQVNFFLAHSIFPIFLQNWNILVEKRQLAPRPFRFTLSILSTFIHFHLFHPLSSTFIHFHSFYPLQKIYVIYVAMAVKPLLIGFYS